MFHPEDKLNAAEKAETVSLSINSGESDYFYLIYLVNIKDIRNNKYFNSFTNCRWKVTSPHKTWQNITAHVKENNGTFEHTKLGKQI